MQCYFTLQTFECFDIPIEELWAEFDVLDGMRMHSIFCRHSNVCITNDSITDEEFFNWLSKVVFLMGALTVSRICLLMQLKSFYVRLIILQEGLFRKLSLQSFKPEIHCPIYWIRLDGSSNLLDENACLHSSNKLERFLYKFLISSWILRTSVSLQQS